MVKGSKTTTILLNESGSYLGMEKGCFVVKDKQGHIDKYPLFEREIGEVVLKSGNTVSTGALASLGFWDIDVLIMTQRGRPVAMLKSFDDDAHVKTRLCQYEALSNGKGIEIAKQLVKGKYLGQNHLLRKYCLKEHDQKYTYQIDQIESDELKSVRQRLTTIEGHFTKRYFRQIFTLFPKPLQPAVRKSFQAYDSTNNLFNLAYEILAWKVHRAIVKAKLEPFLGFLHSLQHGKPSLVCDLQEVYRHILDDFLIRYCQALKPKDFMMKSENISRKKKGKREYLNDIQTGELLFKLNQFLESHVEIPRIRYGKRQTLKTLINEEAYLLAGYLRNEREKWFPRIAS
ncbi:MAG: CRISPR-associated endonuclease Cas1 [Candidatus Hodarchaeales archaeon]|jgi:CRISPR-associated protein Cas1